MILYFIFATVVAMLLMVLFITQPVWVEKASLPQMADAELLRHQVTKLAIELPRGHDARLKRTAEYIRDQIQSYVPASLQAFEAQGVYGHPGGEFYNVVARLGDQQSGRKAVVIGAHYDTFGALPGADDNASGVAGLIELARLLKDTQLRIPVELVAYALEEPPFFRSMEMGSAKHAAAMAAKRQGVRFMISLEMIGYFDDKPGSQQYPVSMMNWFYPRHGDFIAVVGNLKNWQVVRMVKKPMLKYSGMDVRSINAPGFIPGVDFSDHRNYWQMGFPAVMITDTAFYRNTAYHTPHDTPDRLNYKRMAQVIDGVYGMVLDLNHE